MPGIRLSGVEGLEFSATTREEQGYLRLVITGKLADDLPGAIEQYARLSAMTYPLGHKRILVDARAMESRLSIPDTFEFVGLTCPEEPDVFRRAVIERPEHVHVARFFESLLRQRGRVYRVFFDEAEALAWLFSDEP
ncbi:MAG: hypothetical protein P4L39_03755 [Humidesulfovibrio sp.]|nr:hypothetical protein [Humidesulfovibrio sp.]